MGYHIVHLKLSDLTSFNVCLRPRSIKSSYNRDGPTEPTLGIVSCVRRFIDPQFSDWRSRRSVDNRRVSSTQQSVSPRRAIVPCDDDIKLTRPPFVSESD